MKKWIIGFGGFLLAVALVILGRDGRALKKVEHKRDDLLATGIKKDQDKAEKLNKKAEGHKAGAKAAAEATTAKLNKMARKDRSMRELVAEWNGAGADHSD